MGGGRYGGKGSLGLGRGGVKRRVEGDICGLVIVLIVMALSLRDSRRIRVRWRGMALLNSILYILLTCSSQRMLLIVP